MNQQLIDRLSVITEEEQAILAGRGEIDATLYSAPWSSTAARCWNTAN